MTPKEKAEYLIKRYSCLHHGIDEDLLEKVIISDYAIESASIAVDEIIQQLNTIDFDKQSEDYNFLIGYWNEVKEEIDNFKQ